MNGLPYYKAYPRDFIEGTIGMRFELKGAYRLVLDLIYMQGGELPDDARYISGLMGCSIRKWKSLRDELVCMGKLSVIGEFLTNKRAVSELETLRKLQDKQAENRRTPNKINGLATPPFNHTEPEPDTERKNPPTPRKRVVGDDANFERFWSVYPRKIAKGQARKAWATAIKKAEPETIIASAGKMEDRGKFTPHPATWLNGERWLDGGQDQDTADYLKMMGVENEPVGNFSEPVRDSGPPRHGRDANVVSHLFQAPAEEVGKVPQGNVRRLGGRVVLPSLRLVGVNS